MTVRRAVISGPGVIAVEEAAEPAPGAGELLIAPDAVGICGTDVELLDGTMAYLTSGRSSYPLVPGHEWTGIVLATAPGVEGFAAGDRVVGESSVGCGRCERCAARVYHLCARRTETGIMGRDGALAERLVFPARAAHRIPAGVERLDAALIEPLAVAYRGLTRAAPTLPARIGIIGGGTIGLLCALAARALGVEAITLVEPQPSRRGFAASTGIRARAEPEAASEPVVIEAAGAPRALDAAVRMCADGGTVVVLGLTGTPGVEIDIDSAVVRDVTIKGSLSSPGVWPDVVELVATGRVSPSVLVTNELPLDRVADALELTRARAPGTRKVIVRPV